jgi:hypothetical protein
LEFIAADGASRTGLVQKNNPRRENFKGCTPLVQRVSVVSPHTATECNTGTLNPFSIGFALTWRGLRLTFASPILNMGEPAATICIAVAIVCGVVAFWLVWKNTPEGEPIGLKPYIAGFAAFIVVALLIATTIEPSLKASRQVTEAAAEQAKVTEVESKLRADAQKQLDILRQAAVEGRRFESLDITYEWHAGAAVVRIRNNSPFRLESIEIAVTNVGKWNRYLDERTHGIKVRDMPKHFRADWLTKTGHWETRNRIRAETHRILKIEGPIDPGAEVTATQEVDEVRTPHDLKVEIKAVTDSQRRAWCSDPQIQYAELFAAP